MVPTHNLHQRSAKTKHCSRYLGENFHKLSVTLMQGDRLRGGSRKHHSYEETNSMFVTNNTLMLPESLLLIKEKL